MTSKLDWLLVDPLFSEADIKIKTACLQTMASIHPLVEAVYPAKAVHGFAGIMVEMAVPLLSYQPLIGDGAVAFFCWEMRERDPYGNDDTDDGPDKEVSGFTLTIKPVASGICLRHSFEIPSADEDGGYAWQPERPDPLPEGIQEACILRVASAPGFGQLRTIAQREEFAAGLLTDVDGVSPHISAICRGAESEFAWNILPKEAKNLKAQGLSATKIAAKLGVSRAKVDRALEADMPST